MPLEVIPVGIQNLVLFCPAEELKVKTDNEKLRDGREPADLKNLTMEAGGTEEDPGDESEPTELKILAAQQLLAINYE